MSDVTGLLGNADPCLSVTHALWCAPLPQAHAPFLAGLQGLKGLSVTQALWCAAMASMRRCLWRSSGSCWYSYSVATP